MSAFSYGIKDSIRMILCTPQELGSQTTEGTKEVQKKSGRKECTQPASRDE